MLHTKVSLGLFLALEKKISKHFLTYMNMAAILFNDVEPFEQIDNTSSIEGPM